VRAVAEYCCPDTVNTYNLFQLAEQRLGTKLTAVIDRRQRLLQQRNPVARLLAEIDDPNLHVLARMIGEGILIDQDEVARQRPIYERSIQACRELIWRGLGIRCPLDTPRQLLRVLQHLDFTGLVDFDPFAIRPMQGADDHSTFTSGYLLSLFDDVAKAPVPVSNTRLDSERHKNLQVMAAGQYPNGAVAARFPVGLDHG
jgi:hypothetical protein